MSDKIFLKKVGKKIFIGVGLDYEEIFCRLRGYGVAIFDGRW